MRNICWLSTTEQFVPKKITELQHRLPTTILPTCPRKDTWQWKPPPAAIGLVPRTSRPPVAI